MKFERAIDFNESLALKGLTREQGKTNDIQCKACHLAASVGDTYVRFLQTEDCVRTQIQDLSSTTVDEFKEIQFNNLLARCELDEWLGP